MTKLLEKEITSFKSMFCKFGYLDIEFCIKTALEIGEDAEWVFNIIENYKSDTDLDDESLDICFLVYLEIFQSARNEILDLTQFDIDEIENLRVAGNYLATSFDSTHEAVKQVNDIVKDLKKDDLSLSTQYFLKNLD